MSPAGGRSWLHPRRLRAAPPWWTGWTDPEALGVGPHGRIVVGQGDGTIGYVKDGAFVKLGKVPAPFIAPAVSVGHDSNVAS